VPEGWIHADHAVPRRPDQLRSVAPTFRTFPRPLKAVVAGVPAAGVLLAVVAAAAGGFSAAQPWRWFVVPACLVGVVLAEKYPVKIGPEQKVNLGALPCLVAVLLLPPGVGPATAALSVFAGNRLVGRTWPESWLNSGNTLAAGAVAAMVGSIGDVQQDIDAAQALRATAASLLYIAINLGLAALPPALHGGLPYLLLLRHAASTTWPALLTLGACGVSIAVLAVEAPVAAPLPLIVLPMIYRMNRAIEAQGKANEQLAGVLAAQRRFLTDVSHQVATPLATIMTNLSILRRASRGRPAEAAVADSVAEAERMKRMRGRLRSLAHADGPGVESDRLPRLFERFQRSDSGSGLGLAIARRVVERHGGTIRVKTEPGTGSTFTIELPG